MNLSITRLNVDTTEENLRNRFSEFGEISSVKIIIDRETGLSKGFGFVEMPNDNEGQNAIDNLNEAELDGRTIIVKKAYPREDRRGTGTGGYGHPDRPRGGYRRP